MTRITTIRRALRCALVAGVCSLAMASAALAQAQTFHVPAGDLKTALDAYIKQSGAQVLYRSEDVKGKATQGAHGSLSQEEALVKILQGSGLSVTTSPNGARLIVKSPQNGAAPAAAHHHEPIQEVVVTGTNIRRAAPAGNTVQMISAEDIAVSGRSTAADFLRELPANFAGGVGTSDNVQGSQDAGSSGANLTGGQGVNLRGLGSLSTLVLINGRRVASSGQFGDFVDISTLAGSGIGRIEVLQDGASAVYGSDAVGGVVNFVMKRGADGLTTTARIGTTTQGGGEEQLFNASYGKSWTGGRLFATYEYNKREAVSASDRDLYNGGDLSYAGGVNWRKFAARASTTANIFSGAATTAGTVAYTVPEGSGTGLTVASLIPATGGMGATYDAWANVDILPAVERHSLFVSWDQNLGDKASLYGDFRYSHRETEYNNGYAVLFGTVPATSPYYITGVTNNFGVVIDDVGLKREAAVDSLAGQIGLRYDLFGDWRLETAYSYSREEQSRYENMLRDANIYDFIPSGSAMVQAPTSTVCALMGVNSSNVGSLSGGGTAAQQYCAALNYETFNPYSSEPLSQTVLNEIMGYADLKYTSWLSEVSAKVDGTLFSLPGGALKMAAGLNYRKEHIDGKLNFNYRSISPVTVPYGTTEREVSAAFVEMAIPVIGKDNALPFVRSFDISAAVRYEHGSGLGGFNTTNPKISFAYVPFKGLTARGSWGTSFHAPPMRFSYDGAQPVPGGNAIFARSDLYVAPCSTTMVTLNGTTGTPGGTGNCTFTALVVSGGAGPTLKPEEAETWTFGLDYAPSFVEGLKLSASYFNIKIDDRIVRIQGGTLPGILSSLFATGTSPYASNIVLNPSSSEVAALMADPRYIGQVGTGTVATSSNVAAVIYATQMNLSSLKMDGLDFSARYRTGSPIGDLGFDVTGTKLFSYDLQAAPGSDYVDYLGKYSSVGNPVPLRAKAGVSLDRGPLKTALTANYVDSYACESGCYVPNSTTGAPVLATTPIKIDAWTTLDLSVRYDLDRFGGWGKGSTVSFNVTNLTDEDPPFIDGGTAVTDSRADPYDAANATVIGRTVALTFTKRW